MKVPKLFRKDKLLLLAYGLYVASIFTPAVLVTRSGGEAVQEPGLYALLLGPAIFINTQWIVAWFANISFFIAIILIRGKRYRLAAVSAFTAFLIGLQSFAFLGNSYLAEFYTYVFASLLYGFYIWEASFLVLTIYCLVKFRNSNKIVSN